MPGKEHTYLSMDMIVFEEPLVLVNASAVRYNLAQIFRDLTILYNVWILKTMDDVELYNPRGDSSGKVISLLLNMKQTQKSFFWANEVGNKSAILSPDGDLTVYGGCFHILVSIIWFPLCITAFITLNTDIAENTLNQLVLKLHARIHLYKTNFLDKLKFKKVHETDYDELSICEWEIKTYKVILWFWCISPTRLRYD